MQWPRCKLEHRLDGQKRVCVAGGRQGGRQLRWSMGQFRFETEVLNQFFHRR